MSIELKIPEMGESVTEIYIGKWYKSEGDQVEQDEQLVELESEKATLDLRAPADGVLSKILKDTGDTADVGEVIAQIEERDGRKPTEKAEAAPQVGPPSRGGPAHAARQAAPSEPKPAAKKKVEEPAKKPPAEEADEEIVVAPEERAAKEVGQAPRLTPAEPSRREERVPMSPVRRRIAQRLVEAQQDAALLTTFNEIDMTAVKELRAQHGDAFQHRHGVRLGFMSFFVKATIAALEECPELNAMIDDDAIVYRRYYDIGVAISTDKGLVVPVLRDADQMSFAQIEKSIDAFAAAARDGKLKVDDLQGGTFTITNGGIFGSLLSTPIVNPPQSGVLGMHAIQNRPVAINLTPDTRHPTPDTRHPTADSPAQILIRPMMYVALTYDHRIVDGREAVTFLRRIKETIEEPARLLIEV